MTSTIQAVEMPCENYPINVKTAQENLSACLHIHKETEIIFVKKGRLNVIAGQKGLVVNEGEMIFVCAGVSHATQALTGLHTEVLLIQFHHEVICNVELSFSDLMFRKLDRQYYLLNNDMKVTDMLKEIEEEVLEKRSAYQICVKTILMKIIVEIYRLFENGCDRPDNEKIKVRLSKVFDYIETNYANNITVESASKLACLNYHYFCRQFKLATQKSFVEYLNSRRVAIAQGLLEGSNELVTDIAGKVGFSSISYFNRTFKKIIGCSPTAYRKNLTVER